MSAVDRPPQTDAEWARDTDRRITNVEHPEALRAGGWVISPEEGTGDLIASHVDGGSVRLAEVPASDADPDDVQAVKQPTIAWLEPELAANVTTNTINPVKYRVVDNFGDRMVQLRGRIEIAGGATDLWTMPEDMRPVVNLTLLVARDFTGGSNVAQLTVNADGTMVLTGGTTGVRGTATGSDGGQTTHTSGAVDVGPVKNPPFTAGGQPTTDGPFNDDTGVDHVHQMGHTHAQAQHFHGQDPHTHTLTQVAAATWISLDGVMYQL